MPLSSTLRVLLSALVSALLGVPAATQCATELLHDPAGESYDRLGMSVAYDGTTLVAGSGKGDTGSPPSGAAGHVLIWRRVAGELVLEDTLVGLAGVPAAPGDRFGHHVAVFGDRLAVTSGSPSAPGVLALFERHTDGPGGTGAHWEQIAAWDLLAEPPVSTFGRRIALSAEVVAFGGDTDFSGVDAVYYATHAAGFSPLRRLVGQFNYGQSIALSGKRLAVGSPSEGGGKFEAAGVVRTYTLDGDGYFVHEGTLFPPPSVSENFGRSLRWGPLYPIATLFVGIPEEPSFYGWGAGEVWEMKEELQVFPQPPIWVPGERFVSSSPSLGGYFGADFSVEVPPFGTSRLVIGAPGEGDEGNLHVFESPLAGGWSSAGVVPGTAGGSAPKTLFANRVAHHGTTAAVSHQKADGPGGFMQGAVTLVSLDEADCTLQADPLTLYHPFGGPQALSLDLGPAFAGDLYWILGSASGTSPGFPLFPFVLPLAVDPYFLFSAQHANSTILVDTFGTLDANGRATAAFVLPPGAPLFASSYYHAAGVFRLDPVVHTAVTNAVEVTFTFLP
jgi:hypothetical protein